MGFDENDMVKRLKIKDSAAFSELYDHFAPSLLKLIRTLEVDELKANKLLQEVFVECWRSINLFNAKQETLFVWMVRMAINRIRTQQGLSHASVLKQLTLKMPRLFKQASA